MEANTTTTTTHGAMQPDQTESLAVAVSSATCRSSLAVSQAPVTMSLTPCEQSKIEEALAEGVRLAEDRYRLSDLYENAETCDIQRESLGLFEIEWEAVRGEVDAVSRIVAYDLFSVLKRGDEAFHEAKERAALENTDWPKPPRHSAAAFESPVTFEQLEARLCAAGMAVGAQRPARNEEGDAELVAHRVAIADRDEWLNHESWRQLRRA